MLIYFVFPFTIASTVGAAVCQHHHQPATNNPAVGIAAAPPDTRPCQCFALPLGSPILGRHHHSIDAAQHTNTHYMIISYHNIEPGSNFLG